MSIKRIVVLLAMCASIITWDVWLAFRWPDMTWSRRWLEHPGAMVGPLVLTIVMLTVYWWPARKRKA